MKAMLFAAGLGTRLRPLTNDRPKALVEVKGMTLLEIVIRRLVHFGFTDVVVNVHHFADKVEQVLADNQGFGANIMISDERVQVLETGGGLKKASRFFEGDEPFLVHNVDVITNLDLKQFYEAHLKNDALATLAVRKRSTSRYLIFDKKMQLRGWQNIKTGEIRLSKRSVGQLTSYAFSGLHVISPRIFPLLTETGKFSIIQPYLRLAKTEHLQGFDHSDTIWVDVGKHESLAKAGEIVDVCLEF